ELTAAGLPADARQQVVRGFQVCFTDRAHAKDPASVPASCAAVQRQIAQSPAPVAVKAEVATAVRDHAVPAARLADFVHSMRTTLWWQIAVFTLTLLLVARLPRVRLDGDGPMVGGA